mgnify:CR=1 FL=1
MHPFALHRADHVGQSPDRRIVARPPEARDAFNPELGRSVPVAARSVVSRLDTLHIRKRHWSPINIYDSVVQDRRRGGDGALLRGAAATAHQFGGAESHEVARRWRFYQPDLEGLETALPPEDNLMR